MKNAFQRFNALFLFVMITPMLAWGLISCSSSDNSVPARTAASGNNTGIGTTSNTSTDTQIGTNSGIGTGTSTSTATTTISGTVHRTYQLATSATGRGDLCVAIGNSCLSTGSYSSYTGIWTVTVSAANLTSTSAQIPFSIPVPNGKLTSGTTYYVIAMLEDGGGNCWIDWKKVNLISWAQTGDASPCASFTFQQGAAASGLTVSLNAPVPINCTFDPNTNTCPTTSP